MSLLNSLYQEAILEHYKRPHNHGALAGATVEQEGLNPSCGDELTLYLRLDKDKVTNVAFTGAGCAISQASASLMTEAVKGKTAAEALELARQFKAMLHGQPPDAKLGELKVLQGVAKLHARVKCATLAWVTLERALEKG